ncbi:hypothetical protein Ahy_A09g042047 [Arachis hypogaea]|uniref:Protein FAR1-RELATED SEQUENCE n=1 Tax=Arachis hypogaea TaxID=3818 RepID=A0A445BEN0_ARAHY|nr:hypothetical protein Ahy_A09g042047 [Arachis hypogaea]
MHTMGSQRKLLSHPSLTAVGFDYHHRHRPQRPSSINSNTLVVRSTLERQPRGHPACTARESLWFLCSMSTLQVEGVSSVVALPAPSPHWSTLMECVVAEPVDCVPSLGGNEISSNPNENIVEPLVVDHVQMTKATQMLDVTDVGGDEMDIWDKLPNHGTLEEDEIPSVGMQFAKLQLAHDFYVSYAKKVGFATKIRTTTFDKITKEPVNQAIHCNRDRIRGSRVKAPTRKNPISAAGCKARIYVKFDKEKQEWLFFKVEKEKLVHDTMICDSYVVHFDRSTQEVRCDCNLFESSGVLCCHCLEVFHSFKVYKVPSCYVLPCWSKNIKRKHTYIKSSHDVSRSDVSHDAFKGLCAHFYNIAQEFVNDDDETALLHAALEETRAKLSEHRAKKRSVSVVENHRSIGSQHSNVLGVVDIQAPLLVTTKGRPKSKRLGATLEKSLNKSSRRKNKNASRDTNTGDPIARTVPEQVGSFMSLLSPFDKRTRMFNLTVN